MGWKIFTCWIRRHINLVIKNSINQTINCCKKSFWVITNRFEEWACLDGFIALLEIISCSQRIWKLKVNLILLHHLSAILQLLFKYVNWTWTWNTTSVVILNKVTNECLKLTWRKYDEKSVNQEWCEPKLDYTENTEEMCDVRKYRVALGSLISRLLNYFHKTLFEFRSE